MITLHLGPHLIALGLIITGIISTFINAAPNRKILNYSYKEQLSDLLPSLFISIIMGSFVYAIKIFTLPPHWTICLQVLWGGFIYLVLSIVTKQKGFIFIKKTIKDKL